MTKRFYNTKSRRMDRRVRTFRISLIVMLMIASAQVTRVHFPKTVVVVRVVQAYEIPLLVVDPRPLTVEEVKESFYADISAYSELDSCHYPGCPTASGARPSEKTVACPRRFKLGTAVEIEGVGRRRCEDRLSTRYDNRFDLWQGWGQEGYDKAINWGVKRLKVTVLK